MNNQLAQIDFDKLQGVASPNFPKGSTLAELISGRMGSTTNLVNLSFFAAGTLTMLYLIYGGISLMLSRGDPKAISASKSKITNALIGFLVVFSAYWIVQAVAWFLGLGTLPVEFG